MSELIQTYSRRAFVAGATLLGTQLLTGCARPEEPSTPQTQPETSTTEPKANEAVTAELEETIASQATGTGAGVIPFDFDKKTVELNCGIEMPIIGLGCYSLTDQEAHDSVVAAMQTGMRLIDTAHIYGNEEGVGQGIIDSGVNRDELFLITKLYMDQYSQAADAIDEALEKLQLDYIDMLLLHHPSDDDVTAWKAMEEAVDEGKLRSIGLSNYYEEEYSDFVKQVEIPPALVQNEIHPQYQESDVIPFITKQGSVMQAWFPLGGRGYTEEMFALETLNDLAATYNKSVPQIILRWHLQRGVVAIPGSANADHIQENFDIFDFELTEQDMSDIANLETGDKHEWY